jgi:hypothetical protein
VILFTGWDYQLLNKYYALWSNLVGQLSVTNKLHGVESLRGYSSLHWEGILRFLWNPNLLYRVHSNIWHLSKIWFHRLECYLCFFFLVNNTLSDLYRSLLVHMFIFNCRFVSLSRMKQESIISFCMWVVTTLSARQVGLTYRGSCCFEFLRTHLNRLEAAALHPATQKCGVCC